MNERRYLGPGTVANGSVEHGPATLLIRSEVGRPQEDSPKERRVSTRHLADAMLDQVVDFIEITRMDGVNGQLVVLLDGLAALHQGQPGRNGCRRRVTGFRLGRRHQAVPQATERATLLLLSKCSHRE